MGDISRLATLATDAVAATSPAGTSVNAVEELGLGGAFRSYFNDPTTRSDALAWVMDPSTPAAVRELLQPLARSLQTAVADASLPVARSAADVSLRGAPSLRTALEAVPESVLSRYNLSLSSDGTVLRANPPYVPRARLGATRGISSRPNEAGGRDLTLASGAFGQGKWMSQSIRESVVARLPAAQREAAIASLVSQGFDVDKPRPVLVVNGATDRESTSLFFAQQGQSGVVSICSEVAVHDFTGGVGGSVVMRKPVVYLYPQQRTTVRVDVTLGDAEFTVRYPKPNRPSDGQRSTWEVVATPDGSLFVPETERVYSYLFWEADARSFTLDAAQAFCVAGEDAEDFLERSMRRLGLNDRERTDFVSYWLPHLEANRYSVVQFMATADYERYAKLDVSPKPDSVLRIFMIFRAVSEPIPVGAPELPMGKRSGFTVVEWGGASLTAEADFDVRRGHIGDRGVE